MDEALNNLLQSHGDYLMEVNAQLWELRFAQFVDRWVNAAKEVKAVAVDIIGVVDEEGYPIPSKSLKISSQTMPGWYY